FINELHHRSGHKLYFFSFRTMVAWLVPNCSAILYVLLYFCTATARISRSAISAASFKFITLVWEPVWIADCSSCSWYSFGRSALVMTLEATVKISRSIRLVSSLTLPGQAY